MKLSKILETKFFQQHKGIRFFVYGLLVILIYRMIIFEFATFHAQTGEAEVRRIWSEIPISSSMHVESITVEQVPIRHIMSIKGTFDMPNEEVEQKMKVFLGSTYRYQVPEKVNKGVYDGYTIKYVFDKEKIFGNFILCLMKVRKFYNKLTTLVFLEIPHHQ